MTTKNVNARGKWIKTNKNEDNECNKIIKKK